MDDLPIVFDAIANEAHGDWDVETPFYLPFESIVDELMAVAEKSPLNELAVLLFVELHTDSRIANWDNVSKRNKEAA